VSASPQRKRIFVADIPDFRYVALSQDEEILMSPDMEAAAGL
jgi:hypothetical protein